VPASLRRAPGSVEGKKEILSFSGRLSFFNIRNVFAFVIKGRHVLVCGTGLWWSNIFIVLDACKTDTPAFNRSTTEGLFSVPLSLFVFYLEKLLPPPSSVRVGLRQ
jgi:hypothetical protein